MASIPFTAELSAHLFSDLGSFLQYGINYAAL